MRLVVVSERVHARHDSRLHDRAAVATLTRRRRALHDRSLTLQQHGRRRACDERQATSSKAARPTPQCSKRRHLTLSGQFSPPLVLLRAASCLVFSRTRRSAAPAARSLVHRPLARRSPATVAAESALRFADLCARCRVLVALRVRVSSDVRVMIATLECSTTTRHPRPRLSSASTTAAAAESSMVALSISDGDLLSGRRWRLRGGRQASTSVDDVAHGRGDAAAASSSKRLVEAPLVLVVAACYRRASVMCSSPHSRPTRS